MRVSVMAAALLFAAPAAAQTAATSLFDTMRSTPLTPGSWTYRSTPAGSESRFAGLFAIRCDRVSRLVTVQRTDPALALSGPMTVATDTVTRSLPSVTTTLLARDSLLDAIAFSRGRFVVTGGGGAALVIPAWPEAARSIEDCRN
jgi:hypothetical protein